MGSAVLGGLTFAPVRTPFWAPLVAAALVGPLHVGRLSPSLPGHLPSEPQLCALDQLRFLVLWLLIRTLHVIYSHLARSSVVNFHL